MEDVIFLEVDAGVRYWEDAIVNGFEDIDGTIPCRDGERWKPIIELSTGKIINWVQGVEASIHYKVCDDGDYWLLDENKKRVKKWDDYYVPDGLLVVDDNGYGDYIIFKVSCDGTIIGFNPVTNYDHWKTIDKGEK